jgi:hypothetical protein
MGAPDAGTPAGLRTQATAVSIGSVTATRPLPRTQLEGLAAEGTETTLTIAAGAVGNRKPIRIVSERWYSPELEAVLLTRRVDPRFGRTEFRLTKIERREPPASIFEIPPDFRVHEVIGIPVRTTQRPPQ